MILFGLIVFLSLMPKGVEHSEIPDYGSDEIPVFLSLMPKGVEHLPG